MDTFLTNRITGQFGERLLTRRQVVRAGLAGMALTSPMLTARLTAAKAGTPTTAVDTFGGRADIGGRSLWLESRGTGGPTVILEAGAEARGDIWSRDIEKPAGERKMVLPGVAAFSRVYAYDRPGTIGDVNPDLDPTAPCSFPAAATPCRSPAPHGIWPTSCTRC